MPWYNVSTLNLIISAPIFYFLLTITLLFLFFFGIVILNTEKIPINGIIINNKTLTCDWLNGLYLMHNPIQTINPININNARKSFINILSINIDMVTYINIFIIIAIIVAPLILFFQPYKLYKLLNIRIQLKAWQPWGGSLPCL